MLQPKKKKQPPINNSLKTGIDFIQNTSKMIGRSRAAKNIIPMGSAFGLIDSFANNHPYQFSDMVGVVPTTATQIASLILDMTEKEKENFGDFATKKMQGKNVSKIKPKVKEIKSVVKETIPTIEQLAFGTNQDGIMKSKINFRKKYGTGTGPEGLDFFIQKIPVQETPAQKAAREAKEARLAERAKLVAIQKAKNAARLAPIEAARAKRIIDSGLTEEEYNKVQEKMANMPDVPLDGLEIDKAKKGYKTKGSCTTDTKIERVKLGAGTGKDGIMKTRVTPRKKYANGTNTKGVGPNNYIQTPNDVLNDYNIMLAGVEKEVANNKLVPIVSMAGSLIQQGIGMAGSFAGQSGIKPGSKGALDKVLDVDPNKIMLQGAEGTVAANGNNSVQKDVEVEGGEMYETPQGDVGEFKGPSHEQGGIPLEVGQDVEEGTKVYSDRLKVGDKTLAERKEARERQIANLEKIASQPLVDSAVKNATKRRMMAIQKEESADLQFQEQVNNMQQMADIMVAAFGTGMAGLQDNPVGDSMDYAMGTGADGVMKYPWGTPPFGVKKNPYADPLNYDTNAVKNLHDALGITPEIAGKSYGKDVGPKTLKAYQDFATGYMKKQGYPNTTPNQFPDISRFYKDGKVTLPNQGEAQALGLTTEGSKYIGPKSNFYGDMADDVESTLPKPDFSTDALASKSFETTDPFAMTAGEDWAAKPKNALPEGIEEPMAKTIGYESEFFPEGFKTGSSTETAKKQSKAGKFISENMPGVGDLTKLFGNYLGMTAGIKTAAEQRSTDITHTNVYKNAGKESQKLLDNAKQGIETSKAQAMVKATDVGRGGKRGARNSARGVNQMRGMDWLYDTALQSQIAEISANAAQQLSGIDVQKSGVAMNADQLRGQGEYDAAMANEAAKDAYYTALGKGRNQFAEGLMQSGKDLNAMKQNKILEKLLSNSGEYAGMTTSGEFFGKPSERRTSTSSKTSNSIEIPDGKGGKISISQAEYKKLIAGLT